MNLLLDTHILIWTLNEDPALSEKARELIESHIDVLHKSAALLMEKEKIGREEFEALFEV